MSNILNKKNPSNLVKEDNPYELDDDLPLSILTPENQLIDLSSNAWKFRARAYGGDILHINWKRLIRFISLSSPTVRFVQLYIIHRLQTKKGNTVYNDFANFIRFFKWLYDENIDVDKFTWDMFDEQIARSYLEYSLNNLSEKGNGLSRLREFYSWGVANNLPLFSIDKLRLLKSIRAIGNLKGHNVRFHHKTKGPFTQNEIFLITQALKDNIGTLEMRIIIMLHLELGNNPTSISMLRNKHFHKIDANKNTFFQLDVPRIKKRSSLYETKRRPISKELGELIEIISSGRFPEDFLCFWLDENFPTDTIRRLMVKFSEYANLISPRTGQRLQLNPRRFRSTLASNMAEQGSSLEHIVEILDHSDTQNAKVYIETASTIIDSVEKATENALRPLVDRFQGKIITTSNGKIPDEYANKIINGDITHLNTDHLEIGGIGGCGKDIKKTGLCNLYPPLSCYLCPFFAALDNAPHSKVKQSLESYLDRNKQVLDTKTLSQFDEIITAIQNLTHRIDTNRDE